MSLNLDCAQTGERFSKSMGSDIICDTDTCFILNHDNPYSASKNVPTQAFCCKYLLILLTYECAEASNVDPDQEQSDWVRIVCLFLH